MTKVKYLTVNRTLYKIAQKTKSAQKTLQIPVKKERKRMYHSSE